MPLKQPRPPSECVVIDEWDGGVGWLAYPEETMERASHALRVEHETDSDEPAAVWLVDPLRAPGVDDLLDDLGAVVGVVVLLDRHGRDAAKFARRYDVPLYLPAWIDIDVPDDVGIVRIEDRLPDSSYDLIESIDFPGWHEAALTDGETLVVGDAVGSADYFRTSEEELGVHPFLRFFPPKALRGLHPTRLLTGHGSGVMSNAAKELENALSGARRRIPRLYVQMLRDWVPTPWSRTPSSGPDSE